MSSIPVIHLGKPLKAVSILNDLNKDCLNTVRTDISAFEEQGSLERALSAEQAAELKQSYQTICTVLQDAVGKINSVSSQMFKEHNEAIARLSVEIARKVLMQKVTEGDYEIESIIKEAINSAPEKTDLIVRLNPHDLANFQELQFSGGTTLSGIEFVADSDIGQAECIVESSKGIIKLLIDEHLEQISKALSKTG